jgi:hypothetical protein
VPTIHFRLVASDISDGDGERFKHELRLKVDNREETPVGKSTVRAIKSISKLKSKIPGGDQFTIRLKTTTDFRSPPGDGEKVIDWFVHWSAQVIPVLDSAFRKH